jgi:metacaspase-1
MIRAVVVGINAYPHSPLRGCVNDAQDIIKYLLEVAGCARREITPLYDSRATKSAILTALRQMIAASKPGDHLLFHYSGHGSQIASQDANEADGLDECLCPVDFDFADPRTALRDNELAAILASVPTGVVMTVLLDSCHSGDMERAIDTGPELSSARRARSLAWPEDVAFRLSGCCRKARRSSSVKYNAVVISACRSSETSADTVFGGRANGAFTYHWLKVLRAHPAASLADLMEQVAAPLEVHAMHPELDGLLAAQQAAFLGLPGQPVAVPVAVPAPSAPSSTSEVPVRIVLDRTWTAKLLGMELPVELRISLQGGGVTLHVMSSAGIQLCWSFAAGGDMTRRMDLGHGFELALDVSRWRATSAAIAFEVSIQLVPPFLQPIAVARQHVAIPIAAVEPLPAGPASPADLLAVIQQIQLGPAVPPAPPVPRVSLRDGDASGDCIVIANGHANGHHGPRLRSSLVIAEELAQEPPRARAG